MMMKRFFILMVMIVNTTNANSQNVKKILDYFSDLYSEDTIMDSEYFIKLYRSDESEKNILDTTLALHYFFNDNVADMHDIEIGYNADENIDIYTPYTKKVRPLYKKLIDKDNYLLCYGIKSIMYLAMYNSQIDKIENNFVIVDIADDYGNWYTYSTIFPNNYILTLQVADKAYYILSKIDYESRKFIELKRIETTKNQTDDDIWNNAFNALGISRTGELLEGDEDDL
jgi:hypothetical protein